MARHTSGWVKLHRDVLDTDLIQNPLLWGIFNYLLVSATYKNTQILWKGKQRELPPGSIVFGIKRLADMWKCSPRTISKWLHHLHETQRIVLESCAHGTIVTMCNWKDSQGFEEEPCAPTAHALRTPCARPAQLDTLIKEQYNQEPKKEQRSSKKTNAGIRSEYPSDFDEIWVLYSRKGDKKASYKNYQQLNLTEDERQDLITAIKNVKAKIIDPTYRKDLERFLLTDWREKVNPIVEERVLHPSTQKRVDALSAWNEMVDERENIIDGNS